MRVFKWTCIFKRWKPLQHRIKMKFIAVCVAIACANLFICPGIYGSQCFEKPSAHLESSGGGTKTYPPNTVIKDFSASGPNSFLAGGMTVQGGVLTVPLAGRYYIYGLMDFNLKGRVIVYVNDKAAMLMADEGNSASVTSFSGGVFQLNAGDSIKLKTYTESKIYVGSSNSGFTCYFGAYMI